MRVLIFSNEIVVKRKKWEKDLSSYSTVTYQKWEEKLS